MKSIVTIGGGTGQYALLSGLKKYPLRLTAVVSMADDGGSTGVLRDELGVLPPGDVRQCLVALSDADSRMRQLFSYRYDQGGLKGHSFGNIFLSTLEKLTGSFEEAVRVAGQVLAVRGQVMPVSTGGMTLVGGANGEYCGEHAVSHAALAVDTLRLEPEVYANPHAIVALEQADAIVIGPGNLFSSIIPNLLVRGVPEAIAASKARVVYNCNLMTRRGQTEGWRVDDFVRAVERYIGAGRIDVVTANDAPPDPELRARYADEGEPVLASAPDQNSAAPRPEIVSADLVSRHVSKQAPGDVIRRTLIRHDPDALASLIVRRCIGGV